MRQTLRYTNKMTDGPATATAGQSVARRLMPNPSETKADRAAILQFARETAEVELGARRTASIAPPSIPGSFGGVFVTFWNGPRLRGCVGSFANTDRLCETVADVTRSSLHDVRFASHPISADELPRLTIEISILTTPQRTGTPLHLKPGRDGVLVIGRGKTGCFLPKVAVEHGWTAEELLNNCCAMKAGLPAAAWRDADVEVHLFTADVLRERQPQ